MLLLASSGAAQAQASAHVVVIRATEGVPDAEAEQLDASLLAEVARTSGLGTPELASLELAEIELAAGCSETAAVCLRAIARMVGAQSVLVRKLRRTPPGLALTLTWFDASSEDEPRSIEVEGPDAARLRAQLPRSVRRLFGVPEPVVAAAGTGDASTAGDGVSIGPGGPRVPSDDSAPGVSALPLLIAAGGAAALAVGVVFGLLSADAQDRYATTMILTSADADTALAALDEARSRALVANVLYGAGGTLMLVGGIWLVIDLATGPSVVEPRGHFSGRGARGSRASARAASWGFAPVPGGAMFSLQGSL